jgi:hypothetical protein
LNDCDQLIRDFRLISWLPSPRHSYLKKGSRVQRKKWRFVVTPLPLCG